MAIKIQVKDNRGASNTFTASNGRFANSAAFGTPIGVTPIAQYGDRMNAACMPKAIGYGVQDFGMPSTQRFAVNTGMYGMTPMWQAGLGSASTSLASRIAMVDPTIAQSIERLVAIDPVFVNGLTTVAAGCPWTAARIARLALANLPAARAVLGIATVDPHQALGIVAAHLGDASFSPAAGLMNRSNTAGLGSMEATLRSGEMPVTIVDNGSEYILEADLPGASTDDVELTVANGILEIEAIVNRAASAAAANGTVLRERDLGGTLRRTFTIGNDVDPTEISAHIVNGVLTIVLPRKLDMAGLRSGEFVVREANCVC